jgi:hypothetical protein
MKEGKKMTISGFYQFEKDGQVKTCRNVKFESTGIKWADDGKVIWRKISKDGKRTNKFAEQFRPNVPWAFGIWFCKISTKTVLDKFPELQIEE